MSEPSSSAGGERTPPLAQDLVRYTWKFGEGEKGAARAEESAPDAANATEEESEMAALRAQVRQFTSALEDIVTLALSSADYKERAIMMHRRAVAALSELPVRRTREASQK